MINSLNNRLSEGIGNADGQDPQDDLYLDTEMKA